VQRGAKNFGIAGLLQTAFFGRKEKRQEKEISSATAFLHPLNEANIVVSTHFQKQPGSSLTLN